MTIAVHKKELLVISYNIDKLWLLPSVFHNLVFDTCNRAPAHFFGIAGEETHDAGLVIEKTI